MQSFIKKLRLIATDPAIRNRVLFVLAVIALFRVLANIPIPGVNSHAIASLFENNQYLGLFNIFSGGGLSRVSIVMLGVGPYITGSIIMQLLTVISPKIKSMYHEEGEAGRLKFAQISRYITVPLALLSSFGFLTLLRSQGVIEIVSTQVLLQNVMIITAGCFLLLWLGELATEFGIGNGVSLIIFAGIVASMPTNITHALGTMTPAQAPLYIGFAVLAVLVIYGVVVMTQAERRLRTSHARDARLGAAYGSTASYIPLRLNQSGVMPIIFAISLLSMPQMLSAVLAIAHVPAQIQAAALQVKNLLANQWIYGSLYFIFILFFSYFYTAVVFEPDQMAKNLQRSGAFIPGVRPGEPTAKYLGDVVTRLTLVGALFLAGVALLPILVQLVTGISSLNLGGTALLIGVSVIIDIVRRVDSQVAMREY